MKTMKTKTLLQCALFAALSAVLSQTAIPIGLVPITLTHISIFLAAGLLGTAYGTLSQLVFVLLGAIGLPVFSNFSGGFGIIAGPRGGFIIGYLLCAFVTGLIIDRFGASLKVLIIALLAGWLATYIPGLLWLMAQTNTGISSALSLYCLPFLPGDIAKSVLCIFLIARLRPILRTKTQ